MERIRSAEGLMDFFSTMNRDNSVCQVFIPGKGKFTIVLQEEAQRTIAEDVESNPKLRQMINESAEAYKEGRTMATEELIKALKPKDRPE